MFGFLGILPENLTSTGTNASLFIRPLLEQEGQLQGIVPFLHFLAMSVF